MNYSKTKWALGAMVLCFGSLTILTSMDNSVEETLKNHYVDHPPIPNQFFVQKVKQESGYAVALHTSFKHDLPLPEVIILHEGEVNEQILKDDGKYPDHRAGDQSYATIINQNPDDFINQITERENLLETKGYSLEFNGHSGEMKPFSEIKPFNIKSFDVFELVELNSALIQGVNGCEDDIKKQNSLFITDIDVVEDQARTYNVVSGIGASQGAWTFGMLMKNMAGGFTDEANPTSQEIVKVREFLKQWINEINSQYSVNGQTSPIINGARVLKTIPMPWLKKVLGTSTPITYYNWETYWDSIDTPSEINSLLANAPFKLSAIVNRVDLRGNASYGLNQDEHRAGETRFIFSLVQILNEPVLGNSASDIGKSVYHDDVLPSINPQLMDWQGMNVILEYKNMEPSDCDVRNLANDWVALSSYDMNDDDDLELYLEALQNITDKVTARNANPNGINGSAISQVRTNTKLFVSPNTSSNWRDFNWNLREFGLDATTGNLVNRPTANMPFSSNNTRKNSKHNNNSNTSVSYDGSSEDIVDWIYGINGPSHKNSVLAGNHSIPEELLQPSSEMLDEQQSYFDLGYWDESFPNTIFDVDNYMQTASHQEKEIRHQLSLNTCMGCHGGETKTLFTMIKPLGYGEEADYWSAIPSSSTGLINAFDQLDNFGLTYDSEHKDRNADPDNLNTIPNHEQNYYEGDGIYETRTIPNVSPFLTGRNYRGTSIVPERRWDDDYEPENMLINDENTLDINNELADNKIGGLFYVNDPSNDHPNAFTANNPDHAFPQVQYKKYGYNELEKRKMDLCHLISTPCGIEPHSIISFAGQLNFIPLPPHGH